jgi:hypothetical protein
VARRDIYVAVSHGVGTQTSKYADKMLKRMAAEASRQGAVLYAKAIHWAPLLDLMSTAFLKDAQKRGQVSNPSRKLVTNTLADALMYRADRPVAEKIYYVIDYDLRQLRGSPVHFIGHSLGCLVFLDYLMSRNGVRVASFNTMGCNIPLFTLGAPLKLPVQLQPGAVNWRNYYYDSDALGFPLCGVPELQHVQDRLIGDSGGFQWSDIVPGLSHVDYFGDAWLAKKLMRDILATPTR